MCSWIGRCWSSTDPASSGLDSGHNCRINPNECCWLFKRAGWLGEGGENKACSWKVDWDANRRAPGPVSAFSKQNGSLERHNGPCLQLGEGGCLFWGLCQAEELLLMWVTALGVLWSYWHHSFSDTESLNLLCKYGEVGCFWVFCLVWFFVLLFLFA